MKGNEYRGSVTGANQLQHLTSTRPGRRKSPLAGDECAIQLEYALYRINYQYEGTAILQLSLAGQAPSWS